MQHKNNLNPLMLKSPEVHLSNRYRWLRQAGVCFRMVFSVLFALLLMCVFPVEALSGPKGPEEVPPPLVTVATVTEQDVNPPAEYVGHVEAVQTVDLRARIEGFLEQVKFKEGSDVCAGDLLYVIEQTAYQAKVDADMAIVTQATATFTKARQYLERVQRNFGPEASSNRPGPTLSGPASTWDTPWFGHRSPDASGPRHIPGAIW